MSDAVMVTNLPPCDFCQDGTLAEVDGKTKQGPWANMCDKHFRWFGTGLGTGKGQKLVLSKAQA